MGKNKSFLLLVILTLFFNISIALAVDMQLNINAGSLLFESPELGDIPEIVLNGTTQFLPIEAYAGTIIDATGSGSGWTLKISATPLTDGVHPVSRGSFALTTVPSLTEADPSSSAASNIYSVEANQYIDQETPLTIFSAGANEGMGSYRMGDLLFTLTIRPKEFFAGNYSSTLTYILQANT